MIAPMRNPPMREKIIPFNAKDRTLAKARSYLSALDTMIEDGGRAIDLLINALAVAENDLKLKIVLMLGTMADARVIWPLHGIMIDHDQNENLCHAAAVQLSLVGGMVSCDDADALAKRLIADLENSDPFHRANAAFALGWEGNQQAVPQLVDLLCDSDIEVQQAAVSALSNIRDENLFIFLTRRLKRASKEQQRCILYHLGCFSSKHQEVIKICAHYLTCPDADLRYDALVMLDAVSGTQKPLGLYLKCLKDSDVRIREQSLNYLMGIDNQRLKGLEGHIQPLLKDPSASIRQAVVRVLHHIYDGPGIV